MRVVKAIISEKSKIAVGMSGGVDSSVAALLLKEKGYDVTGVFMQCWDARMDGCKADEDKADAIKVAGQLGIKFMTLDFRKEYKKKVISYFYGEYEAGRTPNPDVMCNKEIKFGLFLEWAMKNGFEKVATGHYARVKEMDGKYYLLKGIDPLKDQSYFLYLLNQRQLSKTMFPVGDMTKKDLRVLATKENLPTCNKPDSMGICFVGEVSMKNFLRDKVKAEVGVVVNSDGEVIGKHEGLPFYTIGQRHGFEVDRYYGIPLYVTGKNVEKNELEVGFAKDVNRSTFSVRNLHWITVDPGKEFECEVRIRHLGDLHRAVVRVSEGDEVQVYLEDPIFGIAPGQSAVFYQGDVVMGGGIIAI